MQLLACLLLIFTLVAIKPGEGAHQLAQSQSCIKEHKQHVHNQQIRSYAKVHSPNQTIFLTYSYISWSGHRLQGSTLSSTLNLQQRVMRAFLTQINLLLAFHSQMGQSQHRQGFTLIENSMLAIIMVTIEMIKELFVLRNHGGSWQELRSSIQTLEKNLQEIRYKAGCLGRRGRSVLSLANQIKIDKQLERAQLQNLQQMPKHQDIVQPILYSSCAPFRNQGQMANNLAQRVRRSSSQLRIKLEQINLDDGLFATIVYNPHRDRLQNITDEETFREFKKAIVRQIKQYLHRQNNMMRGYYFAPKIYADPGLQTRYLFLLEQMIAFLGLLRNNLSQIQPVDISGGHFYSQIQEIDRTAQNVIDIIKISHAQIAKFKCKRSRQGLSKANSPLIKAVASTRYLGPKASAPSQSQVRSVSTSSTASKKHSPLPSTSALLSVQSHQNYVIQSNAHADEEAKAEQEIVQDPRSESPRISQNDQALGSFQFDPQQLFPSADDSDQWFKLMADLLHQLPSDTAPNSFSSKPSGASPSLTYQFSASHFSHHQDPSTSSTPGHQFPDIGKPTQASLSFDGLQETKHIVTSLKHETAEVSQSKKRPSDQDDPEHENQKKFKPAK